MGLGGVTASLVTGGAQAVASGADLAKAIVSLGVCTGGTPATLYSPSSVGGMRAALGVGPLAEAQVLLWNVPGAPSPRALVVAPSTAGGVGASVTHVGNGAGTITPTLAPHVPITIKCTTSGAVATAKFQFSLDGGTTYGPIIASSDTGGGSFVYSVPGTFCVLTFAAANYVATKTCVVGTDGTVTNGAAWVGVVTQASSPIDNYDIVTTVITGGALGTATLGVSLDGGRTQFGPAYLTPSGGVVVVPGTGLVLTAASTFAAGDTYSFPCAAPAPGTSDITTAITAMLADPNAPPAAVLDLGTLPVSAASAFTLAAALETALETAFAAGKDWLILMSCPLKGDNVMSGGNAIVDTADTRAVVKTARAGSNAPRVSVFVGTDTVQSAIGAYQVRRPRSTTFSLRVAGKLPVEADRSTVATRDAPLAVAKIGDDEFFATTSLYDAQLNTFQTLGVVGPAYLTIGRGLYGWQSLTTDANEIDADGFRAVNAILAGFRPLCAKIVGRKYPINADGTIEEKTAKRLDSMLDGAIKKRAGFGTGADFGGIPQVSSVTASVDRSSNLGPTGSKVIKVIVSIQPLGFVSAVDIVLYFQGA